MTKIPPYATKVRYAKIPPYATNVGDAKKSVRRGGILTIVGWDFGKTKGWDYGKVGF